MIHLPIIRLSFLIVTCLLAELVAHGNTSGTATINAAKAFESGIENRFHGSRGNDAAVNKLSALLKQSKHPWGSIRYEQPVFNAGKASLRVDNDVHPIHTFYPNLADLSHWSERDFSAPLVYVKRGRLADVKGMQLDGAVALIDFDCDPTFLDLLTYGIKGFVFIEPEKATLFGAGDKIFPQPISAPRYQIGHKAGMALARRLASSPVTCRIKSDENRFVVKELKNLWSFIEGSDPALKSKFITVTVDIDNAHYCPELTSGGLSTLNLFLALQWHKRLSVKPAPYSVLFHFANSSFQDNAGLSHLTHATFTPPSVIFADEENDDENEEQTLLDTIKEAEYIIGVYEGLTPETLTQEKIDQLIEHIERPARRNIPAINPLQRMLDFEIYQHEQARATIYHRHDKNHPDYIAHGLQIKKIGKVVELFKKFGTGLALSAVDQETKQVLEAYRLRVIAEAQARIRRSKYFLSLQEDIKPLHVALDGFEPLLAIEFDLSFGHQHIGLFSFSNYERGWILGNNANRNAPFPDHVGHHIETSLATSLPKVKWIGDNYKYMSGQRIQKTVHYWRCQVPAYAFRNPYDQAGQRLTNADTLDNLDPDNVESNVKVLNAAFSFILQSTKNEEFISKRRAPRIPTKEPGVISGFFSTRIKDGSSLTEPETVLKNSLIVAHGRRSNGEKNVGAVGGKLAYRLFYSAETGTAVYHNLPVTNSHSALKIEVYGHDEKGKINIVLDHGSSTRKFESRLQKPQLYLPYHMLPGILVDKADVYNVYIPDGLALPKTVKVLGAKGRFIQDYNTIGVSSITYPSKGDKSPAHFPVTFFFPPGENIRLQFDRGESFLANVQGAKPDEDVGFGVKELHQKSLPPLMAADAQRLNEVRKITLEKKAVTNNLIDSLHNAAGKFFVGENKHLTVKQDPGQDPMVQRQISQRALGSAYSAYPLIRSSLTDMIKAVVFYLAILLPFSFFMQKLLFNFTKVEAQLVAFLGIFFAIYGVFHMMHPAFQLTKNPQVIIISFATLVLTGFVISVLRNKFDYHMKDFAGKFSVDDSSTMKLAGKAFIIGVSNMRRRKIRTTLTCVTIIFITFTMLSFTSVTQSVTPSLVLKEDKAPYDGIYVSHVVMGPLAPSFINTVEALIGRGHIVKRKMRSVSFDRTGIELIAINPRNSETVELAGTLGLMAEEDGFVAPMPMIGGFYYNKAEGAVITRKMAESTLYNWDVTAEAPGKPLTRQETIIVDGISFPIVGIVDGERLSAIKDLRGYSILPQEVATSGRTLSEEQVGEEELPEGSLRDVPLDRFVILPYDTNGLKMATVSLSVKMKDSAETWQSVTNLVIQSGLRFYFGCTKAFALNPSSENPVFEKPGRFYLKSGFDTSIGGLASLIIPLLVSATIIFNTMLSAVHERKKEIGVYNSIGLNPVHIGLFFIAESVVYGIVGSVAGYLIGQVFAKVIIVLGWFQDLNINYSSTSVVYVILFTIVIVVLSSLYPAWVAMKTATSSSGQKKQKIDHANEIDLVFPFSFNEKSIYAINAYIREYMALHADQSVGGFMASEMGEPEIKTKEGRKEIEYTYAASLAPFDLGVLQHVTFKSFFNKTVGAYMIQTVTIRQAGTDANWLATNRPFSNGIRKYLLRWRALSPEAQDDYFEQAKTSLNAASPSNEDVPA